MLKRNKEKGVTLIALVVTIIVLLILAAVSIAMLTGENGIIYNAKLASENTKKENYLEQIKLLINDEILERNYKNKEDPFIKSLKDKIELIDWIDLVLMLDDNGEENEDYHQNNQLIIETTDNYELIVEVDNDRLITKIDSIEKIEDAQYEITYWVEGDEDKVQIGRGDSILLKECNTVKKGYSFVGWCLKQNGEGKIYEANSTYKPIGNRTLYAVWEPILEAALKKYSIEDILNDKDGVLKNLFEDDRGTKYFLENYFEEIIVSEKAILALKSSTLAYEEVMSSEEYFNKLVANNKINYFNEKAKKIPKLTSNNNQGFVLTGTEHASYKLYNAFDGSKTTYWLTPSFGNATLYIQFPSPAKMYHIYYYIGDYYGPNYTASAFELYGIGDDEKEKLISSGSIKAREKDIYFYNNEAFSKYKLFLTAGAQAAGASILDIHYR